MAQTTVETSQRPRPAQNGASSPAPSPVTGFDTGQYPYSTKLGREAYEAEKAALQVELLKVQHWVQETGQKYVMLFEGRDAAGKGGTIKRFMEHLNPRMARVVALNKPTEKEQGQWFFQRYIRHLPTAGEIVLYDRSWYNRAGVERVMNFCAPAEYLEFMRQTPEFERMLTRSGIKLFKYWFSVTQEEQKKRFASRQTDPLKQWKLSPNDKKRARLNCMRHFLYCLYFPCKDDGVAFAPDPKIVGKAQGVVERSDHILARSLHPSARRS